MITKYKEELIKIRNRMTDIRDNSKGDVSDSMKVMDKNNFHHLCLAIGGLDSVILNLTKIL
jgi:hypothetical protein